MKPSSATTSGAVLTMTALLPGPILTTESIRTHWKNPLISSPDTRLPTSMRPLGSRRPSSTKTTRKTTKVGATRSMASMIGAVCSEATSIGQKVVPQMSTATVSNAEVAPPPRLAARGSLTS